MINHLVNQRFEIVEKIGESSFFTVFKARDRTNSQVVAVKTVQPRYAADADFVEALKSGLSATSVLNHPNITRFFDFGKEGDTPYCIVELVRGINLRERIRRIAPFTLSVAVDFACAVSEGLNYAHKVGMVHGDIRPHNIIVSPEGAVKVTDFGVQRAIARSPQARHDVLLRAAPYHAPELSMTQPGTVAGDVYALGATLYEMLTGTPLYAGESAESIADQHAFAAIPSPRAMIPGVPRSVEGIVLKCLQKRPEQRYTTSAELVNDLKSVREALRFGKSLSWSPIDIETATQAPPVAVPATQRTETPPASLANTASTDTVDPVAAIAMPKQPSHREDTERVAPWIRSLVNLVAVIIFLCLFGLATLWFTQWGVPRIVVVPQMTGKPIDEVRRLVGQMKLRPIEHAEYSDKPRDIVYLVDPAPGSETRPNHVINIWFSKGPRYVDVPDVTGMPKDAAEQKLKDAGLTVGTITTDFDAKIPKDSIVRQDVSSKRRVQHDTAVGLVVSDGQKPPYATPNPDNGAADTGAQDAGDSTGAGGDTGAAAANPADLGPSRTFSRTISIPVDHRGDRRVRIVSRDASSVPVTVIDEFHNEGDKIPVTFNYFGHVIDLCIYYDEVLVWERKFDPEKTMRETIR